MTRCGPAILALTLRLAVCCQYVASLSPPSSLPSSAPLPLLLSFLLRLAVGAEFADGAERFNAAAAASTPASRATASPETEPRQRAKEEEADESAAEASETAAIEWADEAEVRRGLRCLCLQLRLPDPDSALPLSPPSTASLAHSLHSLLSSHLSLPVRAGGAGEAAKADASASALPFVRSLPLGLDAGADPAVGDLARGLRLLSVLRMKAVQEQVTQCLHEAQQEGRTRAGRAEQRVDWGRGQVGR